MNWAVQYAKDRWYLGTTAKRITAPSDLLFNPIKSEINNSRPVVLSNWSHAFVWFWYYYGSENVNYKVIRVNLWVNLNYTEWWYYWTNIDYNVDSIYYNWTWSELKKVFKFVISN